MMPGRNHKRRGSGHAIQVHSLATEQLKGPAGPASLPTPPVTVSIINHVLTLVVLIKLCYLSCSNLLNSNQFYSHIWLNNDLVTNYFINQLMFDCIIYVIELTCYSLLLTPILIDCWLITYLWFTCWLTAYTCDKTPREIRHARRRYPRDASL